MSPVDDELTGRGESFPRVSGDEPHLFERVGGNQGVFPA